MRNDSALLRTTSCGIYLILSHIWRKRSKFYFSFKYEYNDHFLIYERYLIALYKVEHKAMLRCLFV